MKFSGLHKQRLSVEKGGMRQNARRLAADEEKCEREDITLEKREGFFERFFGISQSGSNMRTEVLAGITTFITVAYILILNPQILADPFVIGGDMDMASKISNGVFIGTCIGAFIGTILCAVYAKVPLAQAPGMGLNAFFAYTVVLGMGYTYHQTLTIVFISGVLFIVITAVGLRQAIIRAIPEPIKMAITPGIGLFITIVGLKNAGLVVSNPSTLVSMVDFAQWRNGVDTQLICGALVALIGLIVIGVLHTKNVKGSILWGIVAATVVGIPLGVTKLSAFDLNLAAKFRDFGEVSLFKMDVAGLFEGKSVTDAIFTIIMLVLSFSLVNMFEDVYKRQAASCGSFFHWLYAGLDPAPFGPFYPVSFSVFCIWKNMENSLWIDRSSRNRDYIWRSGDFGLAGNPAPVPGTAASGSPSAPVDHGF